MTTITKEATEEVRVREPTAFVWTNSLYDAFDAIQGKKSLPNFGDLIMVWRALHEAASPKSALVAPQAEGRDTGSEVDNFVAAVKLLTDAGWIVTKPKPVKTVHYCPNMLKPGGCQEHNLHCGYPKCDEAPRALSTKEPE